jgi:hypothetical protein
VCFAAPAHAATDTHLSGTLVGFVNNQGGVPQMGAAVFLFNKYDRLVGRTMTNERGTFGFEALSPGVYSIRVKLASFVPAIKDNIRVQPGMRSFLSINLASVLSSVELIYMAPGQSSIMNDDWKWVLRTAPVARPILRIRPDIDTYDPTAPQDPRIAVFSRTRGLLRVSTGEEGALGAVAAQTDLGTAFALATSLFGTNNQLQFSGNLGYASHTGAPTAGFRTSFSNELWGTRPEVAVTMRQAYLQGLAGAALIQGTQEGAPTLRTMSISTLDRRRVSDAVRVEYGGSIESVAFLETLNYFSPYARVTADLGPAGMVELAYSSGMPPAELLTAPGSSEVEMENDLTVLAMFPRVSLVEGDARVQRIQNFELTYTMVMGSRSVSVGAYREGVTNSAVMMAAPAGLYSSTDLLPDLSSNSSVFNIGDYRRVGVTASVTQQLGERFSVSLGGGNTGVLVNDRPQLETGAADELRHSMHDGRRYWIAANVTGVVPGTGTSFTAGYEWTDFSVVAPTHLYLTSGIQPELGLNVRLRQSLPTFGAWNGRMVASAELRNLLAQGYVPIATPDGRTLYLIQNPRALRGGLSFIF